MMKKYLLLALVGLSALSLVQAQQESHYTHFMYNKLYINPAYAGADGFASIVGIYRNQWMGFEGAPVSQLLSFNTPFLGQRVGFGMVLNHDKVGIMNNWNGALSYSYDLLSRSNASLRFGFQGSARYFQVDFSDPNLNIADLNDPSVLFNQTTNDIHYNVGAGLYFSVDRFFLGASVPRLIENVVGFNPNADIPTAEERRHFYVISGFGVPLTDRISFTSAVLGKYVQHAPVDVDINLNFEFYKRMTLGMSYRVGGDGAGDSADFLGFVQLSNALGLGLAYDLTLSEIRRSSAGSAEVLLRWDMNRSATNLKNPRFFF